MNTKWLIVSLTLAGACGSPKHLQYDFGRAFTQAVESQADLTRPSVSHTEYVLYGIEGEQIRIHVEEAASDSETEEGSY